jgi:hypothetical protein
VIEARREFPTGLSGVIERLMAKPPAQRYATAQQVLDDIAALRSDAARQSSVVNAVAPPPVPPPVEVRQPAPQPVVHDSGTIPLAEPSPPPPPVVAAPEPAIPRSAPQRSIDPASNIRYWLRLRGRVTGPFDLPTLHRQIRQGQLSRLHQVSTDQVTWKPAPEVEGLYGPTVV